MKFKRNTHLRLRILAFDPAHVIASYLFGVDVCHIFNKILLTYSAGKISHKALKPTSLDEPEYRFLFCIAQFSRLVL